MTIQTFFRGLLVLPFLGIASAGDWPWWRGPQRNGTADPGQDPPVKFDPKTNCKWAVDLPGRSHGSACVVGDHVFLAAADEAAQVQWLICLDRKTGKEAWRSEIHQGGLTQKTNQKSSWASPTPACDGERVYINFLNGDGAHTTAVDMNGKRLWQTKITHYVEHQGYGSSPALYENLVIASADNKAGGAVCGMDRKTGKIEWKVERPKLPNYPSPIILPVAGKDQVFLTGTELVTSLDPRTGKKLWEFPGATTECVTSTVSDGQRIFTSGGYPKNHVAAVLADGSGKVAWETPNRVYVPSMLIREGYLYAVMDAGVAVCWKSDTGKEMWKGRLGGTFSSSPVLVGKRIYAANEAGTMFVFKAQATKLEILAENPIGDEIYSTPSICDGQIFLRVADYEGEKRGEKLYCFTK